MEDFESPSIESGGSLSSGTEKTREQSEKQRESYKKAQAQIQRSQKDEKKAKGDNNALFLILERFIQNPYYEGLIPLITSLLGNAVPSRYIVSLIALFYPEATIHLLTAIGKHDDIQILLSLHHGDKTEEFDEATLHPSIRTWMSTWVHSSQVYITHPEMSIIMQKKLLTLLSNEPSMIDALTEGLYFFFTSRNLHVEKRTMKRYAEHITSEYIVALEHSLALGDAELFDTATIENHIFFGLSEEKSSPL